jgi:hypothetical protein
LLLLLSSSSLLFYFHTTLKDNLTLGQGQTLPLRLLWKSLTENKLEIKWSATSISFSRCVLLPVWPSPTILNRSTYQGCLPNASEMILNASSSICNYGITFAFSLHMRCISKLSSSSLTSSTWDLYFSSAFTWNTWFASSKTEWLKIFGGLCKLV